ncbi:MAG: hypothetical protein ACQESC_03895 [Nanobdellota archaeon]
MVSEIHSPTLDSIIMVETALKESDNNLGKYQLWKSLPKKMMYQTFQLIINYLIDSGKVLVDSNKKLVWIHNPSLVKRVLNSGVKLR